MTSRRGFLSFLGAAVATATLDPERLLWVPGAKVYSIPAPTVIEPTSLEMIAAQLEVVRPHIEEMFFRSSAFWRRIQERGPVSISGGSSLRRVA